MNCNHDPEDQYEDGNNRYCGNCGILIATWPENSYEGWQPA